ncbi:hypothetical protein [Microbacterium ulmi]|uniref:Uncharacterized protein n=1 Tax=Microbacterium ulmi TaxID=179095 RepID=A0A7Y2LXM1_9MICO|nr:hypothetical protein [Microbacterium ulmi]NII70695.1 hypothetical protein [Microbacterium ulmi]NNH02714.1 hypothetical protein [Microbacterium ulmi]
MSADGIAGTRGATRGRTLIGARALQRLVAQLAGEAGRVPHRLVSATLADRAGALEVSVTMPLRMASRRDETLLERGSAVRGGVISGMRDLAARRVERVDVRFAGVRHGEGGRS